MKCGAARKYLYGTGGMSPAPAEVVAAKRHVSQCPQCQAFFATEKRLSRLLKHRGATEKAPATLRERLLGMIAEERERAFANVSWKRRARPSRLAMVFAATLLLSVAAAVFVHEYQSVKVSPKELVSILIADHIGNLPAHMQVVSSDAETLEGWFRERVDFSFRLPPTSDSPLIGGRLCHLQGQRAALIVYQLRQRRVSLFIFDDQDTELPADQLITLDKKQCLLDAEKGYTVVLWKERGLFYGLVSDAPNPDLFQLAAEL